MAKFNAGTVIETMEYDFTAYGGGAGIIPEPSETALQEFFEGVEAFKIDLEEAQGERVELEQLAEADLEEIAKSQAVSTKEMLKTYRTLIAALCQDQPSETQLALLPVRVQLAFIGWLVGEFTPEGRMPGTKNA